MNPLHRFSSISCCLLAAACSDIANPSDQAPIGTTPSPPLAAVRISPNDGPDRLADLAIARNPMIQAARHRAERLAAIAPQAGAWPDPMMEVTGGSMAETAAGRVDAMAGIKQKVPFPGKLGSARAAANSEAAAAQAEIHALELKIREQVHATWWDLYLAHQTLTLTRESQSVLKAVRDAVDSRVAADQAQQSDQIRLTNELSMIDRDLALAQQLMDTTKARLNSLLNRPTHAELPNPSDASTPKLLNSLESLIQHAESDHPEMKAAEQRVSAFRHRLERAKLEKYPDFTVGISGASVASSGLSPAANGRDQVMATLGITLPWGQEPRRAMIREAQEGIAETSAMIDAKRNDLRYRIEESWYRAKTARDISNIFTNRLIPDAKQAYEITLTGYSVGNRNFNDLIETWRQQLAYRLQHANNQAQIGKAIATLKAAAGIR